MKQKISRLLCLLVCVILMSTSIDFTAYAVDNNDEVLLEENNIDENIVQNDTTDADEMEEPVDVEDVIIDNNGAGVGITGSQLWELKSSSAYVQMSNNKLMYIKNSDGTNGSFGTSKEPTAEEGKEYYRDIVLKGSGIYSINYYVFSGDPDRNANTGDKKANVAAKMRYLLRSFSLENDIVELPAHCFKDAQQLKIVRLDKAEKLDVISDGVFEGCSSLEYVILPNDMSLIKADAIPANTKICCKANTTTFKTLIEAGYSNIYLISDSFDVTASSTVGAVPTVSGLTQLKYKVASVVLPSNTGSVTNCGEYAPNSNIVCEVKPNPGYHVAEVIVDGINKGVVDKINFSPLRADHNITVSFEKNKYTITFDANGGTVATASKMITYEDLIGTMPVPVREGYTFVGWNTVNDGSGTYITEETKYTYTNDLTVYAVWKGANDPTPSPSPNPTPGSDDPTPSPSPSPSLDPNGFNVTYILNGANITAKQQAKLKSTYDTGIIKLPKLKKKDYTFVGWFVGDYKISEISKDVSVCKGDIVVEARFARKALKIKGNVVYSEASKCNISYIKNGGESKKFNYPDSYRDGVKVKLPKLTKEGYEFLGWYVGNTKVSVISSNYDLFSKGENVEVEAKFAPKKYVITFNKNRGMGKMSKYTTFYGYETVLPECVFTNGSAKFNGWMLNKGVSGSVVINAGEKFIPEKKFANKFRTKLYASWKYN